MEINSLVFESHQINLNESQLIGIKSLFFSFGRVKSRLLIAQIMLQMLLISYIFLITY
jgi:hypothetical protein